MRTLCPQFYFPHKDVGGSKRGFLSRSTIGIWGRVPLCWGAVLCTVPCFIASLASTQKMPGATPPELWQPKTFSDITKCPLGDKNMPGWDPVIKSNDGCDCPLKVNISMRAETFNIRVWCCLLDFFVVQTKEFLKYIFTLGLRFPATWRRSNSFLKSEEKSSKVSNLLHFSKVRELDAKMANTAVLKDGLYID